MGGDEEAARLLSLICPSGVMFLSLLPAAVDAGPTVPLFGRFEVEVRNEKRYQNPFLDVALDRRWR